jgi:glycosyltransferase involved in cell wall biosynthesis
VADEEIADLRVAITYHYSLAFGGSERVLEALAGIYPEADFFALFVDPRFLPEKLKGRKITTSFLDRIPGARRIPRQLAPLYPLAVECLDLSGYDLVISADGAATKGVLTGQHTVHLCYCHSPSRSFWDRYPATRAGMSRPARAVFAPVSQYLRLWDFAAAQRIDAFIANSRYVAARIWKYYRRSSTVIHPPVETRAASLSSQHDGCYLSVGRLVAEKRVDLLIAACNRLGRRLRIIGTGPEEHVLRKLAGPTIEFLGRVDDTQLNRHYARCRALLFAPDEDFGIVPLEAQSFGKPVIAYGRGGALETIIGLDEAARVKGEAPTGLFFAEQSEASLTQAILRFEASECDFDPPSIQQHARRFDTQLFVERMKAFVAEHMQRQAYRRAGTMEALTGVSPVEESS